jgi:hypothetical protein
MIRINLKTGEFSFNRFVFTPFMHLDEVNKHASQNELELRLSNEKWSTYRLLVSVEYMLVLMFYEEK